MTHTQARILVVDDEIDMCWALESMLRSTGYRVSTATRGAEALELLAAESHSLAFVDAKLPDIDGFELAAAIRRDSPDTVVILISGYYYAEDAEITESLSDNHIAAFIAKPFRIEQIRTAAREALAWSKR